MDQSALIPIGNSAYAVHDQRGGRPWSGPSSVFPRNWPPGCMRAAGPFSPLPFRAGDSAAASSRPRVRPAAADGRRRRTASPPPGRRHRAPPTTARHGLADGRSAEAGVNSGSRSPGSCETDQTFSVSRTSPPSAAATQSMPLAARRRAGARPARLVGDRPSLGHPDRWTGRDAARHASIAGSKAGQLRCPVRPRLERRRGCTCASVTRRLGCRHRRPGRRAPPCPVPPSRASSSAPSASPRRARVSAQQVMPPSIT